MLHVSPRHPSGVRFEHPAHLLHDEAASVLEQAVTGRDDPHASEVLMRLALFDDDQAFVENWCTTIGFHAQDPALRGSAALAAGHLARRFGTLSSETREMVHHPTSKARRPPDFLERGEPSIRCPRRPDRTRPHLSRNYN